MGSQTHEQRADKILSDNGKPYPRNHPLGLRAAIISALKAAEVEAFEKARAACVAEAIAYKKSATACDVGGNVAGGTSDTIGMLACNRCADSIDSLKHQDQP